MPGSMDKAKYLLTVGWGIDFGFTCGIACIVLGFILLRMTCDRFRRKIITVNMTDLKIIQTTALSDAPWMPNRPTLLEERIVYMTMPHNPEIKPIVLVTETLLNRVMREANGPLMFSYCYALYEDTLYSYKFGDVAIIGNNHIAIRLRRLIFPRPKVSKIIADAIANPGITATDMHPSRLPV